MSMEPAYKLFVKDLTSFQNNGDDWLFQFGPESPTISIDQFHIQGTINRVAGEQIDILIVNDGTGNAKVTGVNSAPGDLSWVKEGVYCSIIGTLVKEGKLPHVQVVKLAKIDSIVLKTMWPLEVEELKNLFCKKISIDLSTAVTVPIS